MILLAGIRSEPPLARVAAQLDRLGVPVAWFDQRHAADSDCEYRIDGEGLRGTLKLERQAVRLEDVVAVYTRLMDDRFLPELKGLPADAPARVRCRRLHDAEHHALVLGGRELSLGEHVERDGQRRHDRPQDQDDGPVAERP